jgi:polynucleotide 5'-kinase involved in rRNA processing
MEWIRDAAEAGKHRGLGRRSRSAQVREVAKPNYQPLVIGLKDGTKHELGDVLSRVVEYFRRAHFAP